MELELKTSIPKDRVIMERVSEECLGSSLEIETNGHGGDDIMNGNGTSGSEPEVDGEGWDSWEGLKGRPERWAPLGAANDSDKEYSSTCGPVDEEHSDPIEFKKIKDDQEQLTSALLALTSHFAQVQLRVSQIVEASPDEKETLLKDLQEFAYRGIPSAVTERFGGGVDPFQPDDIREKMRIQTEKQKDLIVQLKNQLEELESYAYETGEAGLPQSVLLERHKLVVEQLKDKLNLNVDELERLSDDDLKLHLDQAINELVNPMKMKEQLVTQLKTQITDLERFIHFLHMGGSAEGITLPEGLLSCTCTYNDLKTGNQKSKVKGKDKCKAQPKLNSPGSVDNSELRNEEELRARTIQLMRKALTLIQMFAVGQFGCQSANSFAMSMKSNPKGYHWGDLRARLEVIINRVYSLAIQSDSYNDSEYLSDSEDAPSVNCNQLLTTAVRKDLAIAIADLLEHGLVQFGQSQSLVPFASCFAMQNKGTTLTAWDLILKFYQIKNGEKYNSTPARRLSQSFGLEIVGSVTITNKQLLLSAIDNIMRSHTRYKRSPEAQFKAFICSALNSNKLVVWLRLIVRCQIIIENYYQPWSYVAKTGFEDALRSLDKLTNINFDLPVDLAIRSFQNIKDAFQ